METMPVIAESPPSEEAFELVDRQEAYLDSQALAKLQSWLSPTAYNSSSSEFGRHLNSLAPGTGQWIRHTARFQEWHQGASASLWIKGPPGSGKSVLVASMVEHFRPKCPVLHFFFRYIVVTNRHSRSLVQDWLAQLLPYSLVLQGLLQPLTFYRLEDLSDETLWAYLLDGLAEMDEVYCFADALDEMEYNPDFLQRLNNLATFRPDSVKLVLTSRPKQYLQRALDAPSIHINLQQELVNADIQKFVAHRTHDLDLTARIVERSAGLFLFARLLLDQLDMTENMDLAQIPAGLEEIYHNTLARQVSKLQIGVAVQTFLLELITHCARPLRLNEAADILAFKFDINYPKAIARSACGPLIEILEDETMQVIHHSFTEFLLGDSHLSPQLKPVSIHEKLTVTCLGYLQKALDPNTTHSVFPFAAYASHYWPFHARHSDTSETMCFTAVAEFSRSSAFDPWLATEWPKLTAASRSQHQDTSMTSSGPTILHLAAFAGMVEFARTLSLPIDQRDSSGRTPLWWAAHRGHVSMVSFLLERGAEADAEDIESNKPLHEAAKHDHFEVVGTLLKAGVDLLTPKPRMKYGALAKTEPNETAVEYASTKGYVNTIKAMIPFAQPETITAAICMCAAHGRSNAMDVLLESITDVNGFFQGACALHNAVHALNVPCIKALLKRGADPNAKGQIFGCTRNHPECHARVQSRTPLHIAASVWSEDTVTANHTILNLLLGAGANLEARDSLDESPLASIVCRNANGPNFPAMTALIDSGAHVTTTMNGKPFLHKFLENARHISMTETVLSRGADVQVRDSDGKTIWHALLHNIYQQKGPDSLRDMIEYLLTKDPPPIDVETNGSKWELPSTKLATTPKQLDAFKSMINMWPMKAQQCLWHIRNHSDAREYLKILMSAGINLEARENGRTVLLDSVNTNFLEPLIEQGARLDVLDDQNQGALHYYVRTSQVSVIKFQWFISQGLDPKSLDTNGNTILHSAAAAESFGTPRYLPFLQEILKHVSPSAQNNRGYTPLHLYITSNKSMYDYKTIELLGTFNAQDKDGLTPFHLATMLNEALTARILPQADLSLLTKKGESALHLAARARQGNILALLLPHIRDTVCHKGRSALHIACRSGRPESVDLLLKAGSDVSKKDSSGRTPLHSCAEATIEQNYWILVQHDGLVDDFRPNSQICHSSPTLAQDMQIIERMLLDAGAVATRDKNHQTPFDLAKLYGFPEGMPLSKVPDPDRIVMYPVGYRPGPPSPTDEDGLFKRLRTAAVTGNVLEFESIADLALIEQAWYESCLHLACRRREPNFLMLECLVAKGANVNGRAMVHVKGGDTDLEPGPTALHMLATSNHWWNLDAMRFLIDQGADINARNEKGQTPLHVAIGKPPRKHPQQRRCGASFGGHKRQNPDCSAGVFAKESTKLLLEIGSDINAIDNGGQSPLHRAAGKPDLMRLMLDHSRDHCNQALFAAIRALDLETLNILLDAGADPNTIQSCEGEGLRDRVAFLEPIPNCLRSALLVACFTGIEEEEKESAIALIDSLILHGADVFAPANDHSSVLHIVFEHARYLVLQIFFGRGIDFCQRNQDGRTVLMAAAASKERWATVFGARINQDQLNPIKQLLDDGADVHAVHCGRNFLHYMLDNHEMYNKLILDILGHDEAPRLLTADLDGHTPLHYSLRILRPIVCEKLMDMGCVLESGSGHLNALHYIARQYLEPTYDSHFTGCFLLPAYTKSCQRLWQRCVELGVDINGPDEHGSPPLFHFLESVNKFVHKSQNCHVDAFAELFPPPIEARLDIRARNNAGQNALHIIAARQSGHPGAVHDRKLFEFFAQKGLDPLVEDAKGQSALDIAAAAKKAEILMLYKYES